MNGIHGTKLPGSNVELTVGGSPVATAGMMDQALVFDGKRDFVDLGDQGSTCMGNLSACSTKGLSLSMWIKWTDFTDNSYILSTGPYGVKLYYKDGKLTAEARRDSDFWQTAMSMSWDLVTGEWYFVELSWTAGDGLSLYVDLELVGRAPVGRSKVAELEFDSFYIARPGRDARNGKFAAVSLDDLELWYADRQTLINLGFIIRGRHHRILIFSRLA